MKKPTAPEAIPQRFADVPPPVPRFLDPARGRKLRAVTADVEALAQRTARKERLPGLALGVVIDNELAIRKVIGVRDAARGGAVDEHTRFRIGSITKTITAAAVLKLRDDGRLSLDAPAARYLPELAGVVYPTRDSRPMTVRDLLAHSSGLPRLGVFSPAPNDHDLTDREILATLDGFGLESAPGTVTTYSNLGYSLLGLLAGRVARMPYRQLVNHAILAPLGMLETAWEASQIPEESVASPHVRAGDTITPTKPWRLGASEGAAGLYASLADMARFVGVQLSAWPARDEPETGPLRRSSLRESHMVARSGSAFPAAGGSDAPGLGWQVREDCELGRLVWHNGSIDGFSASVVFLPERGVGAVALANAAGADLQALNESALRLLDGTGAMVARALPPSRAVRRAATVVASSVGKTRMDTLVRELRPGWFPDTNLDALRAQLHDVGERVGTCELNGASTVESSTAARFGLRCERGALSLKVRVDTSPQPRITALSVEEETGTTDLDKPAPSRCRR